MIKHLLFTYLICLTLSLFGREPSEYDFYGVPVDNKKYTVGKFTSNVWSARDFAKQHNSVFIIILNSYGCGYCRNMADAIFTRPEFMQWSIDNNIPVVVNSGGATEMEKRTSLEYLSRFFISSLGAPVLCVINNDDKVFGFGTFRFGHVAADGYAYSHVKISDTSKYGVYNSLYMVGNYGQRYLLVHDTIKYYINKSDDLPYEYLPWSTNIYGSTVTNMYGIKPRIISPSDKIIGLHNEWETNTLDAIYTYMPSSPDRHPYTYVDDNQDWYKFQIKKNQKYKISCPTLSGDLHFGYLVICIGRDAAKAVSTNFSFQKMINYSYMYIPLNQLKKSAVKCTMNRNGNAYLAFIRYPSLIAQNIRIKYTFKLQLID